MHWDFIVFFSIAMIWSGVLSSKNRGWVLAPVTYLSYFAFLMVILAISEGDFFTINFLASLVKTLIFSMTDYFSWGKGLLCALMSPLSTTLFSGGGISSFAVPAASETPVALISTLLPREVGYLPTNLEEVVGLAVTTGATWLCLKPLELLKSLELLAADGFKFLDIIRTIIGFL